MSSVYDFWFLPKKALFVIKMNLQSFSFHLAFRQQRNEMKTIDTDEIFDGPQKVTL